MKLVVISLGAGVQSSTMALMAARGQITPMPDCAIFADTQAEPKHVYDWLDWLETKLPFPVYRVTAGNLREDVMNGTHSETRNKFNPVPFFSTKGGMGRRECTRHYKIDVIRKELRRLLGVSPGKRVKEGDGVEQWIGISLDEMQRMKDPRDKWIVNRWPLIQKRMTRGDCLMWMESRQYPMPQRSACTFCPFHGRHWPAIKRDYPEWFADAVEVDESIRAHNPDLYVHQSMIPLKDADLRTPEEFGQLSFMDECEGMCGV